MRSPVAVAVAAPFLTAKRVAIVSRLRAHRCRCIVAVVIATSIVACSKRPPAEEQQQHIQDVLASGGVVDSVLPIAVHLERFRTGTVRTDSLRHASASLNALVERWATALRTRDSVTLNAMVLDRAEFAWLYYPGSAMSLPPYEAPPQLLWGQILASSNEGAHGLLKQFAGRQLTVRDVTCSATLRSESGNSLHESCLVRLRVDGVTLPATRYFGTIVEREKRFKFLGYSNKL